MTAAAHVAGTTSVFVYEPVGESDDREHAVHLLGRTPKNEHPAVRLGVLLGLDQDADARAVDELELVEVEHDPGMWLRQHLTEVPSELRSGYDVELT